MRYTFENGSCVPVLPLHAGGEILIRVTENIRSMPEMLPIQAEYTAEIESFHPPNCAPVILINPVE